MIKDHEPLKMKKIPFTGIRRVLEKANKLEAEGKKIIHFEVGQPDFETPVNIKEAAKSALDKGVTSYSSNYGHLDLRKAIAKKMKEINHLEVDPDTNIMVTVGGQEAVAATIFALLDINDEVIIADPGYIPYSSLIKMAGAVPIAIPLIEENNYNFDLKLLKNAITKKTKMLILSTPSNPTGTMMDQESLLQLAAICKEKDLLVISDEAYEQVVYDENQHISFATLPDMWERTITIQSFSKTYSMCGWRIGYVVAPQNLIKIVVRAHMNIAMSANSFAQLGALEALTGTQKPLKEMMTEFNRRRTLMYEGFIKLGISCNKPQAAFYLFPNIKEFGMGSFTFADYLLDNYGVATVPGVEFGLNGENHIRVSYATSFEDCKEGLDRITKAVEHLRKNK